MRTAVKNLKDFMVVLSPNTTMKFFKFSMTVNDFADSSLVAPTKAWKLPLNYVSKLQRNGCEIKCHKAT